MDKIKKRTGYTWEEILNMNDIEFFRNITKQAISGKITWREQKILENKKKGNGLDQTTLDALNIFGGKIIK